MSEPVWHPRFRIPLTIRAATRPDALASTYDRSGSIPSIPTIHECASRVSGAWYPKGWASPSRLITGLRCHDRALGARAEADNFDIEGVVVDAQQAVLPGATVTVAERRPPGLTRTTATDAGWPLRVTTSLPPAGSIRCRSTIAGFATEIRENLDVQRRPARRAQLHAEAVERAGDGHRRRRVADGADDVRRGDSDDRSDGVREPAGARAQLLPSADARLQRRRARAPARTRSTSAAARCGTSAPTSTAPTTTRSGSRCSARRSSARAASRSRRSRKCSSSPTSSPPSSADTRPAWRA